MTVPEEIGFTDLRQGQTGGRSPVHTHDASGIIHVEAGTPGERFTLGQFPREWGVLTGNGAIAGHPPEGWSVFVNGARTESAPDTILLQQQQEITLVHGTAPVPVPAAYDFPAHLNTPAP